MSLLLLLLSMKSDILQNIILQTSRNSYISTLSVFFKQILLSLLAAAMSKYNNYFGNRETDTFQDLFIF